SHAEARESVGRFLSESPDPGALLVGGGGGTLRAVVEAVCTADPSGHLPESDRVRLGTMRMGSGNLLAKQLGIPRDPQAALHGLVDSLQADRVVRCCIVACRSGHSSSGEVASTNRSLGIALGGFGQFGWLARDVARWRRQWPRLRRLLVTLFGLERWNHLA